MTEIENKKDVFHVFERNSMTEKWIGLELKSIARQKALIS